MILNLQNVSFMSSTMIGKLILLGKKAKAAKVKLRICGANPDLSKVFVAMALHEELAIDPDEATSLAKLK
jgi:anti-sigma B factor antagonist